MAPPTVPTGFPTRLTAGDTVVFDDGPFSDARGTFGSADGYTQSYRLTTPHQSLTVTSATYGAGWRTTITASETASLTDQHEQEAIRLRWTAYVTLSGEQYTIRSGEATLAPNPATLGPYASHNEKALAAIRAAIAGRLTSDIENYQIGGRAVSKIPVRELVALEGIYVAKVEAERSGGQLGRGVELHFGRAR